MPDVSIALSAKDKVSSILKQVSRASGETAKDIDKLQNSLDDIKKTFGEVLEVWRLQRS